MVIVEDYFDVLYGVNLELNKLELDSNGINFVSRTSKNNGVSAKVKLIPDIAPNPAYTISIACGGSVMSSFFQKTPYYSGRDLFYLKPKVKINDNEMIYYSLCLRVNKDRYNYGRQANRTLPELQIPSLSEIPKWVNKDYNIEPPNKSPILDTSLELCDRNWEWFEYGGQNGLFNIDRGRGARKKNLTSDRKTPLITSIDSNNGLVGFVDSEPTHKGNVLTVNRNGSVGEAFYQPQAFCSTEDVHVFSPKFELNKYIAIFLITLIKAEKYRYSYGRKWGIKRMEKSKIKLPVDKNGNPDWEFMENYIKSLPYSSSLL